MAAVQIAESALLQLDQLPSFLWRLYLRLGSKDWDTRQGEEQGLGTGVEWAVLTRFEP